MLTVKYRCYSPVQYSVVFEIGVGGGVQVLLARFQLTSAQSTIEMQKQVQEASSCECAATSWATCSTLTPASASHRVNLLLRVHVIAESDELLRDHEITRQPRS